MKRPVEKCFRGKLHDERLRKEQARLWLEQTTKPKKKDNPALYCKWMRLFHFVAGDAVYARMEENWAKQYKPGTVKVRSSSSGTSAYRKKGHPLYEEYLSHMRAYNKEHPASSRRKQP